MSGRAQALKFQRKKDEDDNWDFLDDGNADAADAPAVANTWTPYEDDGYEMTDPKEFKTRHYLKRYLKNSEKITNELLD
jgi:hypothetical protein